MICKNCAQVEIGQSVEDNKWYEVNNETQLHFYKCPAAPHKNKPFTPRASTKGIELEAMANELKVIKEDIEKLKEVVKAHTLEIDFKKSSTLRNPEDVQK